MLSATACGQHAGVYDPSVVSSDGSVQPVDGGSMVVVDPDTGRTTVVPVDGGDLSSVASGPVPLHAASAGAGSIPAPMTHSKPLAESIARDRPPVGGDTTGITDSTIKIGIHVPLTGTAPMPPTATRSFPLYWDHLCENERLIGGRCVEIVWRNDGSDPSGARAACKGLVEEQDVFMLIGIAGSHLINACARYAASAGVPYLAGGTVEAALGDLHTHFAVSMPHTRQAPLVADLLVQRLDARRVRNGMVRANMSLTLEVEHALDAEMTKRGASIDVHSVVNPQYDDRAAAEIESIVQMMKTNDVRNLYFGLGPMHFVHFVRSAAKQDYHPTIVGSGPAFALEAFLKPACATDRAAHGTLAFNPWPALGDHARFDPDFARAGGREDLDWWMWGMMKTIGQLLELPGRDLTRERFLWHTARGRVASGVFPPVSFTPDDHFGGESMHLLRADCNGDKSRWLTDRTFVRPQR